MTALETVAFRVADASASTLPRRDYGWIVQQTRQRGLTALVSFTHSENTSQVKSEAHQTVTKKPW